MALLSRFGIRAARAFPRPAFLLDRGVLLAHIIESSSCRSRPALPRDRGYRTLPSLAMVLPTQGLGPLAHRPMLLRPVAGGAVDLWPSRDYSRWQQPHSRSGLRVACAAAASAGGLPQEPGRRHSSTKPWWNFWDRSDSRWVVLLTT
jgi:hypothetical protein